MNRPQRQVRPDRRFRPGTPETFENRVVPTVQAIPGIPFVPGGQGGDPGQVSTVSGYLASVSGDTITYKLTATQDQVVTLGIYNSPGGGDTDSENNLLAQKLAYQTTYTLAAGVETTITIQIDDLIEDGDLKLNGRERFQVDFFLGDIDPPEKFHDVAQIKDLLIVGTLFDYEDGHPGKKS